MGEIEAGIDERNRRHMQLVPSGSGPVSTICGAAGVRMDGPAAGHGG